MEDVLKQKYDTGNFKVVLQEEYEQRRQACEQKVM